MGNTANALLAIVRIVFLPTFVAYGWGRLRRRQVLAISRVNILLGWTLVGWIFAAFWACSDKVQDAPRPQRPSDVSQDATYNTGCQGTIVENWK